MKNLVSRIVNKSWFYPFALLLVGLITYELMLPWLGFYWDDWESVYLYHIHNSVNYFKYFGERPFSVLAYVIFFPFVKMTPMVWQLITLFLRWSGVLFIYYTLTAIWPGKEWRNRWIGVLLFVFPGFLQQPVSVCYSRHFLAFTFFACSLFLTALALKKRKFFWLWMPLSVLFGVVQIFMIEYFVVLEIIRPIVIWFILRPEQKEKQNRVFWKTILYWSPFIVGLGLFIWWRLFFLLAGSIQYPNNPSLLKNILNTPFESLIYLLELGYKDLGYLIITVWANAFSPDIINFRAKTTWIAWLVGAILAIPFSFYLKAFYADKVSDKKDYRQLMILGSIALLAGAVPVWSTSRYILAGNWSDRFTLAPMLGAVILVVCALDWMIRTRNQKQWLLAILLASSISLQTYNENKFRLDWENQRNLYWELSWRIPYLEPGTAIIGSGTFTDKSSYGDGSYILNLLFDDTIGTKPRYGYFDIWHLPSDNYQPNTPITSEMRGGSFSGNTSQSIGIYFNMVSGKCVRVLDKIYYKDPGFNDQINNLVAISNLDLITAGNSRVSPDPATFGAEPSHTWCYYFEKADLARQMQDWETILSLKAKSDSQGFIPKIGSEYLPFIEALAQTAQWEQAYQLSIAANQINPGEGVVLCNTWRRFAQFDSSEEMLSVTEKASQDFCSAGNL
jgi:hypothetical protein